MARASLIIFQVRLSPPDLQSEPWQCAPHRLCRERFDDDDRKGNAGDERPGRLGRRRPCHEPAGDRVPQRHEQREPSEQENEALDDLGLDRSRLEPDSDRCERAFDAFVVGQEDERPEVKRHARLHKERDNGREDGATIGVAQNVPAARARRLRCLRGLGLRHRSGARHVLQHFGAPVRRIRRRAAHPGRGRGHSLRGAGLAVRGGFALLHGADPGLSTSMTARRQPRSSVRAVRPHSHIGRKWGPGRFHGEGRILAQAQPFSDRVRTRSLQ